MLEKTALAVQIVDSKRGAPKGPVAPSSSVATYMGNTGTVDAGTRSAGCFM